jgi:hypothetical protein
MVFHAHRPLLGALSLVLAGCNQVPPASAIPEPAATTSLSIILFDESGSNTVCRSSVVDAKTIRDIHELVSPAERSQIGERLMNSGPVIGKVGFHSANSVTWMEFVDPGKNAFCFRVGADSFLRGGAAYPNYRADHNRLYGIDSEAVAEGLLFYRKLASVCEERAKEKAEAGQKKTSTQ